MAYALNNDPISMWQYMIRCEFDSFSPTKKEIVDAFMAMSNEFEGFLSYEPNLSHAKDMAYFIHDERRKAVTKKLIGSENIN